MFDENELEVVGQYLVPSIAGFPALPVEKWNTPITPRENMIRMLEGKGPLWVPDEARDCNGIQPIIMPDARARCQGGIDWFGVEWALEPGSVAAMVKPGTKRLERIEDWRDIEFPDLSELDWEGDFERNYRNALAPDRLSFFLIYNGIFERTADMMGFEDMFCALIESPEEIDEFWTRLADWHIELIRIAHDVYGADMITFHDDMGSQNATFISPDMYRSMCMPHYRRIVNAIHEMGMYACRHCCGNVGTLIPSLIEEGWDMWEGQDSANDKHGLMERYGDDLAQSTFIFYDPTNSDEDAVADLHAHVDEVGMSGRFCCTLGDMQIGRETDLARELYRYSRIRYEELGV